jgi:hypothetical protein
LTARLDNLVFFLSWPRQQPFSSSKKDKSCRAFILSYELNKIEIKGVVKEFLCIES